MLTTKRKRGCNYTAEETNYLLDLVQQHQSAIEDKRTASLFLARKKEAWEKICAAYNEIATSGIRTVENLKTLYDNKKQKAKKSLAQYNGIEIKPRVEQNITVEELKTALELEKIDKWSRSGAGNWFPTITEQDQKVLAIIKEQVTPTNSSDGTNFNFKGTARNELTTYEENEGNTTGDTETASNNEDSPRSIENNRENDSSQKPKKRKFRKIFVNYKQLYFKQKFQNAYLQKRKLLQDIRLRQREHSVFMEEHNFRLKILHREYNEKFK